MLAYQQNSCDKGMHNTMELHRCFSAIAQQGGGKARHREKNLAF